MEQDNIRYALILNPTAGHGKGARNRSIIEHTLQRAGQNYEVFLTQGAGHAQLLARQQTDGFDVVVAIGGDGTIQEVARGLIESGTSTPMGVIPSGTGNDFVKMLKIPAKCDSAAAALLTGRIARVDYGRVTWDDNEGQSTRCFINAVGVGFDASVAITVRSMKYLPGTFAYLMAVLKNLKSWRSPDVRIELLGGPESSQVVCGPLFLVTVANGICSGGGFYLTPDASVMDGMLNACMVRALPVGRVLQIMPKVMFGKHGKEQEVRMEVLKCAKISADVPLPVHADGEICSSSAHRVIIEVVSEGLNVLVPNPEKIT